MLRFYPLVLPLSSLEHSFHFCSAFTLTLTSHHTNSNGFIILLSLLTSSVLSRSCMASTFKCSWSLVSCFWALFFIFSIIYSFYPLGSCEYHSFWRTKVHLRCFLVFLSTFVLECLNYINIALAGAASKLASVCTYLNNLKNVRPHQHKVTVEQSSLAVR